MNEMISHVQLPAFVLALVGPEHLTLAPCLFGLNQVYGGNPVLSVSLRGVWSLRVWSLRDWSVHSELCLTCSWHPAGASWAGCIIGCLRIISPFLQWWHSPQNALTLQIPRDKRLSLK